MPRARIVHSSAIDVLDPYPTFDSLLNLVGCLNKDTLMAMVKRNLSFAGLIRELNSGGIDEFH